MTAGLSPQRWARDVATLADAQLDVLVVGGGIVGAGTALDAARRGLSVGLVEAQDWASGSSSRTSRLVHGGLRYLRTFDWALVREGLVQRAHLLRLAPHLVRPVRFVYPLRQRRAERAYVGAGVTLYDLLARSSRTSAGLPWHSLLSRQELARLAPALRAQHFGGAVSYYDAQVDDARYVLSVVRAAASQGALTVNRALVTGLLGQRGRVCGARVLLVETGEELEVRARVVVSATGAWTERFEELAGRSRPLRLRPSKGVHLVVPRRCIESSAALVLPTPKSLLFVVPWGRFWLVGTTDTPWGYDLARPVASRPDVDYLLAQLNQVLERPVLPDDVVSVFAGVRPLIAGASDETTRLSREHAVSRPGPGLVVVSGGKFTTYRVMAHDAVDAAVAAAGLGATAPAGPGPEVAGGDGFGPLWEDRERLASSAGLALEQVERLLYRYGSLAPDVLGSTAVAEPLAPLQGGSGYLRAEVAYAVSDEGARHVEDVLRRRTRLAVETPDGALAAAQEVAGVMAPVLGWGPVTVDEELASYRLQVEAEMTARSAPGDREADAHMATARPLLPLP